MGKVKCVYHGNEDEDIMLDVRDSKVVLCEQPSPPMTDGCRFGGVMRAFTFLSDTEAEDLGIELITAARKARGLRK